MHSIVLLVAFAFFPVLRAQTNSSQLNNVTQAFSQASIVPDVLPAFDPTALVNITFPTVSVTPGALLTEDQTSTQPVFSLASDDASLVENTTFLLVMVDPDVPSPQNTSLAQFLHFMGGNFSVDTSSPDSTSLVNQSAALLEFFPPSPPAGSPPHRYVLVVYVQTIDVDFSALVNSSTPRENFDLVTFADASNLSDPVAGNYFLVGPDNSTAATSSAVVTDMTSATSLPTATAPNSPLTTSDNVSASASASTSATSAATSATSTSTNGAIFVGPVIGTVPFVILALSQEFLGL